MTWHDPWKDFRERSGLDALAAAFEGSGLEFVSYRQLTLKGREAAILRRLPNQSWSASSHLRKLMPCANCAWRYSGSSSTTSLRNVKRKLGSSHGKRLIWCAGSDGMNATLRTLNRLPLRKNLLKRLSSIH